MVHGADMCGHHIRLKSILFLPMALNTNRLGMCGSKELHVVADQLVQLVAQLIAYPFGRALARITPRVTIFGISLNPGPFTIKEHVLITIMSTVAAASAYAVRMASFA